jgi:ribonuclease D
MMTSALPQLITEQSQWEKTVRFLEKSKFMAIDLEGNGYFRYPEHICLIQIAAQEQIFLIDPLTVKNLTALGTLLQNPGMIKIFHSCDWDLRSLDRDYGFRVQGVFDTSIAARFLGINEVGLGKVLKHFLGVELDKSKSLQRQDWTLRPLNPESVQYAALDVFYLDELRTRMLKALAGLGRTKWVLEECQRMENLRYSPPIPPSEAFWNVKGARELPSSQWNILRQVYVFREQLARHLNRPPFKVMSDTTLLSLAQNPEQDFNSIKGLGAVESSQRISHLREALKTKTPKEILQFPKSKSSLPTRLSAEAKKRFTALKQWRQTTGERLGLDPSLLWPMRSLEFMAQTPEQRQHEFERQNGSEVRGWQVEAFASEIETLFQTQLKT